MIMLKGKKVLKEKEKRKRRRKKERDREKVEKNVKYKKPREVERERGNSKCYVKCERDYTDCCAFFYSKA